MHLGQAVKTDSQRKDSNDSVLSSESNANSATSLVWLLHKWLLWGGSSKWIKCKQCNQCSLITAQMTRMSRFFWVNQMHLGQAEKTDSQRKDSNDSVLSSESNANSATSLVWLLHKWLVWGGSSKWIKCKQCNQCSLITAQMNHMRRFF